MQDKKYYLPLFSRIDLNTGNAETEYIEVTEDDYYEFYRPLASILAEGFVSELLKLRSTE